jgi:hypothetical protein
MPFAAVSGRRIHDRIERNPDVEHRICRAEAFNAAVVGFLLG